MANDKTCVKTHYVQMAAMGHASGKQPVFPLKQT